jgi:hypothetical protein
MGAWQLGSRACADFGFAFRSIQWWSIRRNMDRQVKQNAHFKKRQDSMTQAID